MPEPRINIVLIVMDTARALNFSCYGYSRKTSPNIDEIAEEGLLFQNAISPSPWTLPSHISLFTGLYPSEHGLTEDNISYGRNIFRMSADHTRNHFLPEILKKNGYRTVGFSNNPWVGRHFGFDRGFDIFNEIWRVPQNRPVHRRVTRTVRKLAPQAFHPWINHLKVRLQRFVHSDSGASDTLFVLNDWFARNSQNDSPLFLFFNFMEPHLPYIPPRPFDRLFVNRELKKKQVFKVNQDHLKYIANRSEMDEEDFEVLRALYDGEIAYLDSRMKEIFGLLKSLGIFDRTVLIITSDHGENVGEHQLMGHQFCLYDTLLRVPLIIRYPEMIPKGRIEQKYVQVSDLFFTLMDILDISMEGYDVQKRSLLNPDYSELIFAEHESPRIALSALEKRSPDFSIANLDQELKCIYSEGKKYILNTKKEDELYDLIQDLSEENNLARKYPQESEKLLHLLKKRISVMKEMSEKRTEISEVISREKLEEDTRNKLRDLGYI